MNVRLVMARDSRDAQSEEALAAVCDLIAALKHCEELVCRYDFDRIGDPGRQIGNVLLRAYRED